MTDLNQEITDLAGKSIPSLSPDGERLDKATLGNFIILALLATQPQIFSSGTDKMKRFKLAEKCYEQDAFAFSSQEITMIKQLVAEVFPQPLIVGKIWQLLDPGEDRE